MTLIATAFAALMLGPLGMFEEPPQNNDPPAHAKRGAAQGAGPGMTQEEQRNIHALLGDHRTIERTVVEVPGGVRTRTVTTRPELVGHLREHVRQMAKRVELGRAVRPWDPVFRNLFAHADEIVIRWEEIEGGIEVTETSENPDVVPLIRAHARKVDSFVQSGHAAARPPWAGGRGGRRVP